MRDCDDILISIQGRFIDAILDGSKKVELRRRAPNIAVGTRIWIYDKMPVAAVRAVATLGAIETMAPEALWRRHHKSLGLSPDEYATYLAGCDQATALSLDRVTPIRPLSLQKMRDINATFHPPQFYIRLSPEGKLLETLKNHLPNSKGQKSSQNLNLPV